MFVVKFAERTDSFFWRDGCPAFEMKLFWTFFALHNVVLLLFTTKTLIFASLFDLNFLRFVITLWKIFLFEILIITSQTLLYLFGNLYGRQMLFWYIEHEVVHDTASIGIVLEHIVIDIILVRKEIIRHWRYWIAQSAIRCTLVEMIVKAISIKTHLCLLYWIVHFRYCFFHQVW